MQLRQHETVIITESLVKVSSDGAYTQPSLKSNDNRNRNGEKQIPCGNDNKKD